MKRKYLSLVPDYEPGGKSSVSRQSEHYRAKAHECLARAQESLDLNIKDQFKEMAAKWIELAEQAERYSWMEELLVGRRPA